MSRFELFLSPKGAIGRAQYWGASVVLGVCFILLSAIVGALDESAILGVLFLPALWSSFAITAKRLHDRGKSGWYWVLFLVCACIPVVNVGAGIWAFIELGCMDGNKTAPPTIVREQDKAIQVAPKAVPAQPQPPPSAQSGRKPESMIKRIRSLPDPQEDVEVDSNTKLGSERKAPSKAPVKKRATAKKTTHISGGFYEAKMSLQEIIDNGGSVISLTPSEYHGPIVIRQDCEIDGRNSAIVGRTEPVVRIEKGNVVLRNLCIEVLDEPNTSIALKVLPKANLKCECVTISGCVSGRKGESGSWNIPKTIHAHYPAGKTPEFTFRIEVPVPCELDSRIVDLDLSPRKLPQGGHDVSCKPRERRDGGHYSGDILIRTPQLVRRLPFTLFAQPIAPAGRSDEPRNGEAPAVAIGARQSSPLTRRVVRQDMKTVEGWLEPPEG